jgi:hypothetical protein
MVLLYFVNRKNGHADPQSRMDFDFETLSTSSEDRRYSQDDAHAVVPLADSRSSSPYASTCPVDTQQFHVLIFALAVYSRLSAKNRVPSYSKIHARRPSTAVVQKYRSKVPTSSTQRNSSDQNGPRLKSFDEVRLSSSLSSSLRAPGPRRLARSAHLHTLPNAGRLYQNKQDSPSGKFSPGTAPDSLAPDPSLQFQYDAAIGKNTKNSRNQQMLFINRTASTSHFDNEDSEGASASEAEEEMGDVGSVQP